MQAATEQIRRETANGTEYLVVPMVAMKTGVYQCANCPEPEFYDVEVFGKVPGGWNGRPVTIQHPTVDGIFVSAGGIEVQEQFAIGLIQNARVEDDKLLLEAWIDLDAVDDTGEHVLALVDALESGDLVDVSIGAFVETMANAGSFAGKRYARTQLSYVPDHVAFLPGGVGACSNVDGCGAPRVAAAADATLQQTIKENTLKLQTGGADACA
jgi:hypothetical protein